MPISIINVRALCGRNSLIVKSGSVKMVIHPRIHTTEFTMDERNSLLQKVRTSIISGLPLIHEKADSTRS